MNLDERIIEQDTVPIRGRYTRIQRVLLGDTITSATLACIALDTQAIFG